MSEATVEDRRELTFPIAMDRIVMWLIAGLTAWLCYSTMSLREQMATSLERSNQTQSQLLALVRVQTEQSESIKRLQIQAAAHGWKDQ